MARPPRHHTHPMRHAQKAPAPAPAADGTKPPAERVPSGRDELAETGSFPVRNVRREFVQPLVRIVRPAQKWQTHVTTGEPADPDTVYLRLLVYLVIYDSG